MGTFVHTQIRMQANSAAIRCTKLEKLPVKVIRYSPRYLR